MRINKWISLILWIALFQFVGYIMGMITQANIQPWYAMLNKSSLTPPGIVFSIAWSILYTLLGIIGWQVSSPETYDKSKWILFWFAVQTLMNWAWTPLFFELRWIGFSCFWLVLLIGVNGIIYYSMKDSQTKRLRLIMVPYIIWLTFATYLNFYIWYNN